MCNPVRCSDLSARLLGGWLSLGDSEGLPTGQPQAGISDGSD
ncbi:hypothetical protein [Kistimonas scapharcae]